MNYSIHLLWLIFLLSCSSPISYAVSSFNATGNTKFICSDTEATVIASGAPTINDGTTRYYIGIHQVTAANQNPIIKAFGANNWCKNDYETGAPDGTGIGLLFDGTHGFYAAFTIDGGDGAGTGFENHTTNGWLTNYGSGGGPKASVILKLNTTNGNIIQNAGQNVGTYLISKLSNGNTNSLKVKGMSFDTSGQLIINADAWYSPLNPDKSPMTVSGSSPFNYEITLSNDLTTAMASNLVTTSPSPIPASVRVPWWGLLLLTLGLIGVARYYL